MFSPGFEPGTFCVLDRCDNHYTTKTRWCMKDNKRLYFSSFHWIEVIVKTRKESYWLKKQYLKTLIALFFIIHIFLHVYLWYELLLWIHRTSHNIKKYHSKECNEVIWYEIMWRNSQKWYDTIGEKGYNYNI